MNNKRRKQISEVLSTLEYLRETIESIHADEEDAFENLPESLEGSEQYDSMEEAVSNLEDAVDLVEDLIDALESAKE